MGTAVTPLASWDARVAHAPGKTDRHVSGKTQMHAYADIAFKSRLAVGSEEAGANSTVT